MLLHLPQQFFELVDLICVSVDFLNGQAGWRDVGVVLFAFFACDMVYGKFVLLRDFEKFPARSCLFIVDQFWWRCCAVEGMCRQGKRFARFVAATFRSADFVNLLIRLFVLILELF